MIPASTPQGDDPHQWALAYAALNYRVVPIRPGTKHPMLPAWQNAASRDAFTITTWWTGLYRGHGVGLVTGDQGLFVLDVDEHGTISGLATLRELTDSYGELPDTPAAVTGSGGVHLWLRAPEGVEIRNNQSGKLGPGLDVRGIGGQVVVAPSIHPDSGLAYHWAKGHSPFELGVADAPGWLIGLLTRDDPPGPEPSTGGSSKPSERPSSGASERRGSPLVRDPQTTSDRDQPGDWLKANITWDDLLTADGWTRTRDGREGAQRWVRPGKEVRQGISATVDYRGADLLKVFTSSVPHLRADATYSRLGYLAATRHGGDHRATAREVAKSMMPARELFTGSPWTQEPDRSAGGPGPAGTTQEPQEPTVGAPGLATWFIDWPALWAGEDETEWLVEPLLAKGRGHALYAKAKSGKSLLLLEVCAAITTGRAVLGRSASMEHVRVLYLDMEMTPQDVRERLEAMGYDETADLSMLHYASLPSLPPLNTTEGARWVLEAVDLLGIELVVIDTTSRVVVGEENSADTYRELFLTLGLPLKSRGVTYVRLDHAGKTMEAGQRGSSAKNDDVDVVWEYTRMEGGATLKATHRRMGWVPERVDLEIVDDPVLSHRMALSMSVPEGTAACVADLDRLGVPDDASRRTCAAALRDAGLGGRNSVIGYAVKSRKRRSEWSRTTDFGHPGPTTMGPRGPFDESAGQHGGTTSGTTGDH